MRKTFDRVASIAVEASDVCRRLLLCLRAAIDTGHSTVVRAFRKLTTDSCYRVTLFESRPQLFKGRGGVYATATGRCLAPSVPSLATRGACNCTSDGLSVGSCGWVQCASRYVALQGKTKQALESKWPLARGDPYMIMKQSLETVVQETVG